MIELPECYATAKQLKNVLLGRRIEKIIVGQSPHKFAFFSDDLKIYDELIGKTIEDIYPVASRIEFKIEEYRFILGEGAVIRLLSPDSDAPKKHQFYMELDDHSKIIVTVQMYGLMIAYKEGTYDNIYHRVALEKPTPFSAEFDFDYFEKMVEDTKPTASVKALLATEQRIPGLGNGVLQDILFRGKINPQTKISALDDQQVRDLFHSMKETLQQMLDQGGRNTEKNIDGKPCGYETILSSKTLNNPCPRCNGGITRKAYLGGNVYFCPTCQPIIK